jgi:DivIVA domain-containing protein
VALDRQSIERKDFPVGHRGYDPEAVDAHLKTVADEIDELKRSARRKSETLASSAGEQVRAIVEAAEASAADIQRQAEEEAREIREEASSEADSTREQATAQARDYVGKVSESTSAMLQRLDAMESELSALIESLRTGSNRLDADLQLLEGNLSEVGHAVSPRPRFEPEPPEAGLEPIERDAEVELVTLGGGEPAAHSAAPPTIVAEPVAHPGPEQAAQMYEPLGDSETMSAAQMYEPLGDSETVSAAQMDEPMAHPDTISAGHMDEPLVDSDTQPVAGGISSLDAPRVAVADDDEGARLIALNMALNGTPREETDKYLSESFQLSDRHGLLDEVYASVEG